MALKALQVHRVIWVYLVTRGHRAPPVLVETLDFQGWMVQKVRFPQTSTSEFKCIPIMPRNIDCLCQVLRGR